MFEMGNVTVDDRFARFGAKSFAINKINSVEVRSSTKRGSKGYVLWWGIAALSALVAIGAQAAGVFIVLAALLAFVGWRSWLRRRDVITYGLFLVTSSSEAQAFTSRDADEVRQLRSAIEDAMARSN